MSNPSDDLKAIHKATEQLQALRVKYWLEHDLFSWMWWFLLAFTVIPWVIWWKFADKQRLPELVSFGAIIALASAFLDTIGTVNSWWMYNHELLMQFPGFIPADMADIPVTYMLIYQYCKTWKSFLMVLGVASFVFSFVVEPGFVAIDLYRPFTWAYLYSFIIYLLMGMIVRFVIQNMQSTD